jgi:hypothetical protein
VTRPGNSAGLTHSNNRTLVPQVALLSDWILEANHQSEGCNMAATTVNAEALKESPIPEAIAPQGKQTVDPYNVGLRLGYPSFSC